MAALRNHIGTVLIPKDNVRDLEEIDQTVRAGLNFVPVTTVDEVLAAALAPQPVTVQQPAPEEPVAAFAPAREGNENAALRQ